MIELGHMDVLDVREAADIAEHDADHLDEIGIPYAAEQSRELSQRLHDLADRLDRAFQLAAALEQDYIRRTGNAARQALAEMRAERAPHTSPQGEG